MVNAASDDRDPIIEAEAPIGIDFRDRDLRGRDFSHESLQNADFSGADLRGCNFYNADLSGANFESAPIGFDPTMVHALLVNGSVSALGYLLVMGLVGELLAFLSGPSHNLPQNIDIPNVCTGSSSDKQLIKAPKYVDKWKLLGRSEITILLMFSTLCGLVAIFGTGFLLFGHVATDSINAAHNIILSCLAIAAGSLVVAIMQARDLAQTDFSEADLDEAKIDRATFQQAKTDGAKIDRVTWL
jgi:Pentapeptide repeats (8 copies)